MRTFYLSIAVLPSLCFAMDCRQRVAVIADPWSSARTLVQKLEKKGVQVHGIQSHTSIPDWAHDSLYLAPDRAKIIYTGDFDALEREVNALNPDEILYGADGDGIALVDQLTERSGRRGNPTALTHARTSKTGTQRALRDAGMHFLDSILTGDLEEALAFTESVGGFPIVIKPDNDGGGTNVFFLNDAASLNTKLELILSAENTTTQTRNLLATFQEYADGTEFAVQGTARDGKTKYSSILRYEKVPIDENIETYQAEWLMNPNTRTGRLLIAFVERANRVVGWLNGPFHWELKISRRKNGVVAIELNPRLIGGSMLEWLADCVGYSDADLTYEAYFDYAAFEKRPDVYTMRNHGFVYEIVTPEEGMELDPRALDTISRLPGFIRARLLNPNGGPLPKTRNLDTIGGTFDFTHAAKKDLASSYRVLKKMTRDRSMFLPKPASRSVHGRGAEE